MQIFPPLAVRCIALSVALLSFGAQSQVSEARKEHPLLSGPAGYKLDYDTTVTAFGSFTRGSFGEFICKDKKPCPDSLPGFKGGKFVAEGKVTKVNYRNDKQPAGELAILRNYENAMKQLGGIKLTSDEAPVVGAHLFFVQKNNQRNWIIVDNSNNIVILTFLEEKTMEQTVTAGQLADSISKLGFATLYINFETNKFDIKPEAQPTLRQVVALLKAESNLRLSIEGHTDNVGAAADNKSLSGSRANSVLKFLVTEGIDGKRLSSKGMGSEVPVADNRSDEGRSKNRRVELVKLK
jgi:OmpA-OmpF porin, OOP family